MPSTSRDGSCCGDGVSTRDIGVTKGNSEGGISRGWSKESILRKSGFVDFNYLFVDLSVCLFVCLLVCLFVCWSVCLLVCLFVCLTVCLFVKQVLDP